MALYRLSLYCAEVLKKLLTQSLAPPHNDAAWRLSLPMVPPELTPMLQTATSGVEVGTTALSRSDRTGSWAGLQWQARSFTLAGTGVVTAAAVLLRHAQLSQVALC